MKLVKMKTMKMWTGNLDGEREGLVVASSKKRACEIIKTGLTDFNAYWREQEGVDQGLEFEVLYTRPLTHTPDKPQWTQGRCEIKRHK